jgi:hypothetical protein
MKSDHIKPLLGDGATILLKNVIHVFVVTPRHYQLRDATMWLINPISCAIDWVLNIRVVLERIKPEDTILRRSTTDAKSVTHTCPLLKSVLASNFGTS